MTHKSPQPFYLAAGAYKLAKQQPLQGVCLESPATDILLDFRMHPPVTVLPETSLPEARHILASSHSDVLPVVDKFGHFCGVVTQSCISEQAAIRHLDRGERMTNLCVRDLMTALDLISAVNFDDVVRSTVHNLVALLKRQCVPFLLVVEKDSHSIVGMVTATMLAKLFSLRLEPPHRPTFLDIFDAVMH